MRKFSFGRKKKGATRDYAPMYKTERYHPKIRSNLEIHTENQGFISHNDNAYTMSLNAGGGNPAQSLNAIYNIPSSPYDDKFVVGKVGIADIPMEYKEHIGKNISVPDEEDGNNLKGLILGIRTLDLKDLGEYIFYEVLFQPDKEDSKAVVKLICTEKYGIRVLGLETEAEMMWKIKQANEANLANRESVQMKILDKVAQERNRPKSPKRRPFGKKKEPSSVAVNYIQQQLGDNFAETMLQQGRSSIPDELELAKPSSPSFSRSSSRSRSASPGTLRRGSKFTKGGKKTKKAKKTKKVKKMQKRKKTKRR